MIVYIASPYTSHADKQSAVDAQIDAAGQLLLAGYEPIAPLLSHYIDLRYPLPYARWMQWCMALVAVSDAVLRLPGASVGADSEVARAQELGKPVAYSVQELAAFAPHAITRDELMAANQQAAQDIHDFVSGKLRME
jgi:hypothetical protein